MMSSLGISLGTGGVGGGSFKSASRNTPVKSRSIGSEGLGAFMARILRALPAPRPWDLTLIERCRLAAARRSPDPPAGRLRWSQTHQRDLGRRGPRWCRLSTACWSLPARPSIVNSGAKFRRRSAASTGAPDTRLYHAGDLTGLLHVPVRKQLEQLFFGSFLFQTLIAAEKPDHVPDIRGDLMLAPVFAHEAQNRPIRVGELEFFFCGQFACYLVVPAF